MHLTLQNLTKFTQIGIFGLKIYHLATLRLRQIFEQRIIFHFHSDLTCARKKWREKNGAKKCREKTGAKKLARKKWREKNGAKKMARLLFLQLFPSIFN
jgi:hypothetical protein